MNPFADLSLVAGIAIRTTLVLLVGWAAVRALRNRAPRIRYELAVITMMAVLLVPAVHLVLPSLNVLPAQSWFTDNTGFSLSGGETGLDAVSSENTGNRTDSEEGQPATVPDNQEPAANAENPVVGTSSNAMIEAISFVASTLRSLSVPQLFFLVWMTGIALIVVRFILARLTLRRLWRAAHPVVENTWNDLMEEAGDRVFLTRAFHTRELAGLRSPMTWGILSPRLLLPVESRTWSQERKLNALMHEMVHIRRLDAAHDLLSAFVVALNWFNPLAWMMRAELKAQREASCDAEVLQLGAQPEEYARMLIDVAKDMRKHRSAPRLAMTISRPSQLEGRVLSVLNFSPGKQTPAHRWMVAGCMTFVLLFTAAAAPVSQQETERSMQESERTMQESEQSVQKSDATAQPLVHNETAGNRQHREESSTPSVPSVPPAAFQEPELPKRESVDSSSIGSHASDSADPSEPVESGEPGSGIHINLGDLKIDSTDAEHAIGDLFAVAGIRLADAVLRELGTSVDRIDWKKMVEDAEWSVETDDWTMDNVDVDLDSDRRNEVDLAMGRFTDKIQNAIIDELEKIVREEPHSTKARRARKALLEIDTPVSRKALKRLGIRPLDN